MSNTKAIKQGELGRAFALVATAFFLISWLKGFRFPNLWSATHFAFNYSQGFVRRGLLGELARQIGGDRVYRYDTFVIFAFFVFFTVAFGFYLAIRRALRCDPRDWGFKIAVLVFAASPGLVFFIHTIGYNDYVGILLVLPALLFGARTYSRFSIFYLVIAAGVVSALVHEGIAVMFGPILIFAMAAHILRLNAKAPLSSKTWILLLMHAVVASTILISLSSMVSLIGVEEMQRVQALKQQIIAHADFPIRPKAFDALQRSAEENLTRLMPWYWTVDYHWIGAVQSWKAFAPGYMWLLMYGSLTVKRATIPPSSRWILVVLFLGASLAPLGFNFVGWDWGRWNGLALISSFTTLLTLKMYFPTRAEDSNSVHLLAAGVIVAAIGLASITPLFDGFQVQFFPFQAQQDLFNNIFEDGFQYRPRN